jgi:hypothetical protein
VLVWFLRDTGCQCCHSLRCELIVRSGVRHEYLARPAVAAERALVAFAVHVAPQPHAHGSGAVGHES